ncbi:hypothetical protein BGZ95_009565 [Linnemannia exigua]|uniref:Uncharacterized protein n=1 Tax=Linnemannia exigua TaxID=604196 RepID=A0AAD4DD13_9FUNG|nr:hypothetical protein BGZ95_009565 [Linnemannia exigua]
MEELWRRYQRQRPEDPATLVVHGATTSGENSNGGGNGGNGVSSSSSSENDSSGTRVDHRTTTSEDMVAEKLWEYIVGWCLIGCILCGIALITGANFMVHGDPASATPWTFEPEDGDSLMDNIVANIMKAALGMRDFEDQLMEHGIFVFIVGINGFVLVRQRVFGRRRQHEQELMRGGLLPIGIVKDIGGHDFDGKIAGGELVGDEESGSGGGGGGGGEGYNEGKRDFYEDVERFTTTDQVPTQTGASSTTAATALSGAGVGGHIVNTPTSGSTEPRPSSIPVAPAGTKTKDDANHHHHHPSKELTEDVKKGNGDDNSPDFATMSFLAWFNYLQVGILIIEFLQLFSFPLRELMEFYNQAEKTSAMYEGAKTILDVFRTTAMDPSGGSGQVPSATAGTGAQDKNSAERPSFALEMSEGDESRDAMSEGATATVLDQNGGSRDVRNKTGTPQAGDITGESTAGRQSGGGGGGHGGKQLGASVNWIKENLPSWLPNITALMDNNTVNGLEPGRFEELRDNLVNAAVGVALQGFAGTNASSTGSDTATISSGGVVGSGDSGIVQSPPTGRSISNSGSGGDGDIVMQVVGLSH